MDIIRPQKKTYSWLYYFFPTYTFQRPQHISLNLREFGDDLIWYRLPRSAPGYILSKDFRGFLRALTKIPAVEKVEILKEKNINLFQPRGLFPFPQRFLPNKFLLEIKKSFIKQLKPIPKRNFVLLSWAIFKEEIHLFREIFPESKIVFDLVDDIPGFHEKAPRIKKSFFDTLKEVDAVVSINERLLEKYQKWINVPSIIIPNGVSFPQPPGFAAKNENVKTLGYFGGFDFWFNFDFLEMLARSLPEKEFFLAGPFTMQTSRKMRKILEIPNIKYFGALPFDKIPDFLKEIDILIIPWLPLELCRLADPIKIKEALYAGIPVIYPFSTGDPLIDSKIIITDSLEKIRDICQKSFIPPLDTRKKWAEEIGDEYSWQKLVRKLREFCIDLLEKK